MKLIFAKNIIKNILENGIGTGAEGSMGSSGSISSSPNVSVQLPSIETFDKVKSIKRKRKYK